MLGEHIENLKNVLQTHRETTIGAQWEVQQPHPPPNEKNAELSGCMLLHLIGYNEKICQPVFSAILACANGNYRGALCYLFRSFLYVVV